MKLSRLHPRHFWSAESGMTSLLIFTLVYMFVMCALGDFAWGEIVGRLFFSLIILAGVLTTFRQRWVHSLAVALAVASLAVNWAEELRPGGLLTTLNVVFSLVFLVLLLVVLTFQVFRGGAVTAHRIRGAIVVYLLLGGMWSLLYQLAALTLPQAFRFPAGLALNDPQALQRILTYFSFSTLTTTGFGDITPTNSLTRTLAIFEALTGQLYLVITLARMVSLAVLCPKGDEQNQAQD